MMVANLVLQSPTLEDAFQQAAKIPGPKIFAVMTPLVHKALSFDIVAPEIAGKCKLSKKNIFHGDFTLGSLGSTRQRRDRHLEI